MKSIKRLFFLFCVIVIYGNICFAQYVAIDPTYQIPSARVLALGKAYIGLADDAASLFTNPAGLNDADNWQVTSMSGNFLEEYAYLSFSGFYPTDYGVFGAGYAGYFIGGVYSTTIEAGSDPADPVYTFDFSQPVMENRNEAVVLTYANDLQKIKFLNRIAFADRISLGTNLKLFRASITGDGISSGAGLATGQELDFGIKIYPPQKWMRFGLTLQNMLPVSLGGKLTYATGHTESYPSILEGGSVFNILGPENALRVWGQQDLKVMLDFNMYPNMSNMPMAWHMGTEWKPMPMISIRAAIDQSAGGGSDDSIVLYSDMAYGVGLNLSGFSLDYAYHTFAGAPSIDNHYFSLSYGLMPEKITKEPVELVSPFDESLTFENRTTVEGKIVDPDIQVLSINNLPVRVGLRGDFNANVDLKVGKNSIRVLALAADNEKIVDADLRILRLISFPDVSPDYWVAEPISLLAMQKIVSGYPDGSFNPKGRITRAEMCAMLIKAREQSLAGDGDATGEMGIYSGITTEGSFLPLRETIYLSTEEAEMEKSGEVFTQKFSDVGKNHWAAKYIARAAELGIVLGYPDGNFKPKKNITRAEGVVMISRFAGISKEAYAGQFKDIESDFWAAEIISGAYEAGIIDYLIGSPFQFKRLLTRAETVEMLYRTEFVQGLLKNNLLNWESY